MGHNFFFFFKCRPLFLKKKKKRKETDDVPKVPTQNSTTTMVTGNLEDGVCRFSSKKT